MSAVATTRTVRNRRFECERCTFAFRASRSMIREHGFPTCACGGRVLPVELDDVLELLDGPELESHPVYAAYMAKCESVTRGQIWRGGSRAVDRGVQFRDPTIVATEHLHREMRDQARRRQVEQARLNGRGNVEQEIPF